MCNNDDNSFYVYIHRRETDGLIFYVGKGCKERHRSKKSRNPHWHNVAKKHGYTIEKIRSGMTHHAALDLERDLIYKLTNANAPLTNKNAGGTGFAGFTMPEEVKKKIAISVAMSFTPERRESVSKASMGRPWPKESRLRYSEYKKCKIVHKWENINTLECVMATQHQMQVREGLAQSQTSDLVCGRKLRAGDWRLYGAPQPSEDRRWLINNNDGKRYNLTRAELHSIYGVQTSDASRLFSGKRKSARGFVLAPASA